MFVNKILKKINLDKVKLERKNMVFPDVKDFYADSLWSVPDTVDLIDKMYYNYIILILL